MSRAYQNAFCAFCRSPRRVYMKKHAGFREVFYTFWLGFSLGLLFWQEVNPRFLPIWVTILGLTEILIQLRWRVSLPCQKCGFDPALYLRDPKKAAVIVQRVMKARFENPNTISRRLPVIDKMIEHRKVKGGYRLKWPEEIVTSSPPARAVPSNQKNSESLPSQL